MDGRFAGRKVGRYLLTSLLGFGAAGSVYQAIDTSVEYSPAYAIKCIQGSIVHRRFRQQMAEINNHSKMVLCPNVIALCDVMEESRYFFLVMPLCENDMFRAIWNDNAYWRKDCLIKKVFLEVLDGVHACHLNGVFHRDLKPENIMCKADGTSIKIGDFGLSSDRRLCKDGGCGTGNYMGPECWSENGFFYYADLADVWSLGVILFNMVTACYPWQEARLSDREYEAFLYEDDYLLRTHPISEPLSALLYQIWHPIPSRRLTIPEIREAIFGMDTFYKPHYSACVASPSLTEFASVDSQRTRVASAEDVKMKISGSPMALLDKVPLRPMYRAIEYD